jgi:hypothetical protein
VYLQRVHIAAPYTSETMPIQVSTAEKKAEIARDVVVAYLSHVKDDELSDLGKVDQAITRLVDVVDRAFEVEEHRAPGFGMPPSIPRPQPRQ